MDVRDFYDRHPISETQVLAAVRRPPRRARPAPLTADDLFEFDQDHYGGLAAVDALARLAGIAARTRVLDVCAGLGGPARFLASPPRLPAWSPSSSTRGGRRAPPGSRAWSGCHAQVRVVRGDATALPFGDGRFDACLSQEALLHIARQGGGAREAHRVLAPGRAPGLHATGSPGPRSATASGNGCSEWMAATTLQTLDGYRGAARAAGFGAVAAEDLADEWRAVLPARLRDVPAPAGGHGGPPRRGALPGVRPALRRSSWA